jgi:hypothetical protein
MDNNSVNIYADIQHKLKNNTYHQCLVCGSVYYYRGNKQKHERSLKHKYAEYVNQTMFEITRLKAKDEDNTVVIKYI